ncbi:MAG: ABC-2 family transporter protein [Cyanobacteriota bacterium]|nr:ABC-2 family transporter protein [Cyanobacteriota bacterium]
MLEYRAEIVLWALSGVLPLIMLAVWGQAAAGGTDTTGGLGVAALSRYFLAAFVVRQFTIIWVIHSFEEDIVAGRLSPYLLQPLAPVWRYVAAHLAEQVTRLPFVLAILALLVVVHPAAGWLPEPPRLLAGLLAIPMAFALRFALQWILTMLCFWSERASALERLLYIPYLFLSGLVAPLEAYPEPVRAFAMATPFPWMVHFPAQLLAGADVPVAQGFAALLLWTAVLVPIGWLCWKAGLRRHAALGA